VATLWLCGKNNSKDELLKVSFYTLGCRLNQAETAIIAKSLKSEGYQIVEFGKPADITVINTCTVTEQADAKCRQAIRKSCKINPGTFIAVVGCYAQLAANTIKNISGVDLIIGNEHKLQLARYLDSVCKRKDPKVILTKKINSREFSIEHHGLYFNSTRANLKIQDGCNFICSYCIIPKARGPARSRLFSDIIREAEKLVELGHQELVITGVNIATYSNGGKQFLDVVKELEKVKGLKRLRISSIEPTTIPDELIRYMAGSEIICKHLHIPLQSGDDRILKRMRRKYSAKEFAQFVDFVYKTVPEIGIGTDVMVGFPSETEKELINTKKLLADLPVSYYHVFTYSDRKGTGANLIKEKVPQSVKKRWTQIFIEQGKRKRRAFYERFLGREAYVLFEQKNRERKWTGYTSNYMSVEVRDNYDLHNKIKKVKLKAIQNGNLSGDLV
jgi:threonylcarbamoyladenosine tRNA methylthiotransferase MtaB